MMPDGLRQHEVRPPARLHRGVQPGAHYPGECFRRCVDYVLANGDVPGVVMVDGLVNGEGGRIRHAWVELPGGLVFDGVMQAFFDASGYYDFLDAVTVKRYSPLATMHLLMNPET
jgi:hypothetical protein